MSWEEELSRIREKYSRMNMTLEELEEKILSGEDIPVPLDEAMEDLARYKMLREEANES